MLKVVVQYVPAKYFAGAKMDRPDDVVAAEPKRPNFPEAFRRANLSLNTCESPHKREAFI
jgi:hypothetical protein